MTCGLHRRRSVQVVAAVALLGALAVTIWSQRSTVTGALDQIGRISAAGIALLVVLTVYERWSRADIVHHLLGPPVGRGRAWVVHDVGTAVSKGVPLGGALGTAVRWTIARRSGVAPTRFATTLVAYGVATTFTSWLLPFTALAVDMVGRPLAWIDVAILVGIATVLTASLCFWVVVLRSDRLERWLTHRLESVWARLATRLPSVAAIEPASGVATVRGELLAIARRPFPLLTRAVFSQAGGAVILFVALRSLGVGDELGATEFFRVFFITHLLGTFAPTPGGVGVVEAGMTGALVAAGVPTTTALAGVLVWRLLTYVLPIVTGAVLYVHWKVRRPAPVDATSRRPEASPGLLEARLAATVGPPEPLADAARARVEEPIGDDFRHEPSGTTPMTDDALFVPDDFGPDAFAEVGPVSASPLGGAGRLGVDHPTRAAEERHVTAGIDERTVDLHDHDAIDLDDHDVIDLDDRDVIDLDDHDVVVLDDHDVVVH